MKSDKTAVSLKRLRGVIDVSNMTRKEIAHALNCDTSTITKHYNGDIKVSIDFLVKYAVLFGVSTDYLLELVEDSTPDADIQQICQYTGLTQDAVKTLHSSIEKISQYKVLIDNIDYRFENEALKQTYVTEYSACIDEIKFMLHYFSDYIELEASEENKLAKDDTEYYQVMMYMKYLQRILDAQTRIIENAEKGFSFAVFDFHRDLQGLNDLKQSGNYRVYMLSNTPEKKLKILNREKMDLIIDNDKKIKQLFNDFL